ncbi:hypothetical protein F5Y15DRAFT_412910 [Xylariaceae sp. FL0016]|nr:hypothetical protein F5Y15DRAFT_412910 [Xylariaceae sp. FL0016]
MALPDDVDAAGPYDQQQREHLPSRFHRPGSISSSSRYLDPDSFAATAEEFTLDSDYGSDIGDAADDRGRDRGRDLAPVESYELRELRSRGGKEEEELDSDGRPRRGSMSTTASFQLYTPDEERAVVRKFDRRLVLFLGFCYMLSFLDRSNIGNARIAGMEKDLQTRPPNPEFFPWALRAFYIAYICFEWMSLLWKVVPAHIYVSLIVLSWGVTASLQAVTTSYAGLIALRALLGIGEAGFTGVPYYLSFFFKRRELAFRTAMFVSAAPLATAFAGFLAWVICLVGDKLPIANWRLLFLFEGFPSVIVATIAWGIIPDSPETATYLTPREKKVARTRLRHEKPHTQKGSSSSRLNLRDVANGFLDPIVWLTSLMFFLTNMAYSTLPAFLPTILQEMGHSALEAEALSAPPNLIAFAFVLITARLSDRVQSRAYFIVAHALLSATGYAVLALGRPLAIDPMVRYLAVYPASIGFFSAVVLIIAWNVNNQPDESRRGGGFALLQVVGQCGPLVGARLYPDEERPWFERGMWTCCGAMVGVAVLAVGLRAYLGWLNRRMDGGGGGRRGRNEGEGGDEEEERGHKPSFHLPSPLNFMQQELHESTKHSQQRSTSQSSDHSKQYGLQQRYDDNVGSTCDPHPQHRTRSMSPQSVQDHDGVNPNSLEERLRGLNVQDGLPAERSKHLGQRISEYENALTPSVPRQALGFKVIKRADTESDRVHLDDFPNEILTHILSHLHPDSHASVALVSKRFYSLITTPHAWRMAFQRFFPGQDALIATAKNQGNPWDQDDSDIVRSEVRHFARLTSQTSWRSEYLLRTRLLRSLARGKPGAVSGGIGESSRNSQSGKKGSAVLTYNTKLPSVVTHVHATFKPNAKKPPRAVHGAGDTGVGSASDPSTGRVEKWGLDDPFAFAQLDEVMPQLLPYGVGEGPAAIPNVMDVSQPYGLAGGEGFPGGRVFYRPTGAFRGKYLNQEPGLIEAHPDIPKIPELSEGVCSVWIAKSSSVPSVTQSMVGIMTGSSLGVVTTYALGYDPSGPRYTAGEISARWVVSPGVPIIALKVDESYSQKRKAMHRVWAVALNALGEIYYLTQPPTPLPNKTKADDSTKFAWHAGRSTYWHLVETTRRQARPDESGRNAVRGAYSPRSPSNAMDLTKEQMVAEAREIERFLRYKPAHFRKVCYGWDMRRKLKVDFAGDDEHGAGESIFVVDCAFEDDQKSGLKRFTRSISSQTHPDTAPAPVYGALPEDVPPPSIFGGSSARSTSPNSSSSPLLKQVLSSSRKQSPPATLLVSKRGVDEWIETLFLSKDIGNVKITAIGLDNSNFALVAPFEDAFKDNSTLPASGSATPSGQSHFDIPGRRARWLGIGTELGKVILWNMREGHTGDGIQPVRVIQTDSPEVSNLAITALYLVHGGSDGLVQAWDPLASTLDPIRTINSRSPGRMPRYLLTVNPALRNSSFSAVGAIYLDPDPTVLHGIVAFGTFVRYFAYSSSNQASGRKRRLRHSDVHGRVSGRRHGGGVKGYIAAETEELRNEQQLRARERARLQRRFGVGLGDLTEEEALRYAEMMSQESFMADEQRRQSASDTGSAADFDTASTTGSMDTITPDPSVTGQSPPTAGTSAPVDATTTDESDYELQIQAAIRLSLLEGVNDMGRSPKGMSSGEYDAPITFKEKKTKKSPYSSPGSSHTPMVRMAEASNTAKSPVADDDLELAIQLSLVEEESRKMSQSGIESHEDEFPALECVGKGKGRAW